MAPHSSTLAWKIPWTKEPRRLQSMGSRRVGHDWATSLSLFTVMHWRRRWHPIPLPHGQRSLVGCSPWGQEESDPAEPLHFDFSLSWIGEGNGNPLQCSCLENPRDRGAWWAAVYGVAQSWAQLKWLSSSSRSERTASLLEIKEKDIECVTDYYYLYTRLLFQTVENVIGCYRLRIWSWSRILNWLW